MNELKCDDFTEALRMSVGDQILFTRLIELLPYPVQVLGPDGVLQMINPAFVSEFNIKDPSQLIGKYNMLLDPTVKEYGVLDNVKNAFAGRPMFVTDLKVPVHAIKKTHHINAEEIDVLYQDISTLPIHDSTGRLICVVNLLITRRKLVERVEITKAKRHIENHWLEEFRISEVAKAVHLSAAHFSRMFKQQTGMTAHSYYMMIKMEKVKEKLLDANLSVEGAFSMCGLNYHGYYAKLFKDHVGISPQEYRKQSVL